MLRKLVSLGASGSRQRSMPAAADRRHDPLEDLDRVSDSLVIGYARQEVALLGRAQHHQRAPQVAGRLGQGDQVVARRPADRRVGRGQVEALRLRQQPVQTDRLEAGVFDDRLQLAATSGPEVGDEGRQRERGDFQAVVTEGLDDPADVARIPSLRIARCKCPV